MSSSTASLEAAMDVFGVANFKPGKLRDDPARTDGAVALVITFSST
jgi:hypothetical protein